MIAEPVDTDTDAVRQQYRRALVDEIEARIRAAIDGGHLPEQDAALAAPGAGRGAAGRPDRSACARPTSTSRRAPARRCRRSRCSRCAALGVVDAHARGLVVQTALPEA